MSEHKHTPGPWVVAGESGDYFPTLADYSPIPATEENARLMAVSPKMLDALKTAKWMLERDYIDDQKMAVIRKCDAVIAEATGGEA
jgi:hypothetical protein